MSAPLTVYFVRHGETVNNVLAGQYKEKHPGSQEWRPQFELERQVDAALTERGIAQAERVGQRLVKEVPQPQAIFCSFHDRALRTAKAIADCYEAQNYPARVIAHQDLHENGGSYQRNPDGSCAAVPSRTRSQVMEQFPKFAVYEETMEDLYGPAVNSDFLAPKPRDSKRTVPVGTDGWWAQELGRETTRHIVMRCDYLLNLLAEKARKGEGAMGPIIVITHGDFYQHLVFRLHQTSKAFSAVTEPPRFLQRETMKNTAVTQLEFTLDSAVDLKACVAKERADAKEAMLKEMRQGEDEYEALPGLRQVHEEREVSVEEAAARYPPQWITRSSEHGVFVSPLLRHGAVAVKLVNENDASHTAELGVLSA